MILSASRRTDIPAYYADWFMNRLQEGYVLIRNPMNHKQIKRVPLSPDLIDCIVFWTKNPQNILEKLSMLDCMGYKYYFQFTVTPYDKTIESNLPQKADIADTFIRLSETIGKDKVLWRYDPIILNETLDFNYHQEQFTELCEKLHNYTNSLTISFVDLYAKVKTGLIRGLTEDEMVQLSQFIGAATKNYGLTAKACCEKIDLTPYGIEKASCIDRAMVEKICGYSLNRKADKNQRDGCGCCGSVDIGAYNTCQNGCVYCYANHSPISVANNIKRHDPSGELLIGKVLQGEEIKEKNEV